MDERATSDGLAAATRRWLYGEVGPGRSLRRGWRTVAVLAVCSTGAIMVEPHNPIQLPGHRALGWLALLFAVRLVGGPGWATLVGVASAVGTMAIGRSPNGSVWGVLQYVAGGIGVEAFLGIRSQRRPSPALLAGGGAAILALVGWITPVSNSFVGGATPKAVWLSLSQIPAQSWGRLLAFDVAFGAGAGLIGLAVAIAVAWGVSTAAAQRTAAAGGSNVDPDPATAKANPNPIPGPNPVHVHGQGAVAPHRANAEEIVPGVG